MDNSTPQLTPLKQAVLDPDTLNQILGSSPASDQSSQIMAQAQQHALNVLQQYKQMQMAVGKNGQGGYGPPPAGMSQSQWNGLCEAYAEKQVYGHTGVYPSALAAAQDFAKQGKLNPDISKAPQGSLIYFNGDASNGGLGHVGVADGRGNFTSATYNGVQTNPLKTWVQSTGQQPLGFVIPK